MGTPETTGRSKTVRPVVGSGGHVRCGKCGESMEAMIFDSVPSQGRSWLFWRCLGNTGHLSEMIPLP